MIQALPHWINILFLATFFLTIIFFHFANGKPIKLTITILLWSAVQSLLAYLGFYQDMSLMPPRFVLVLFPATLAIVYGLMPAQRNWLSVKRNSLLSTFSHVVRLPVEIVLYALFMHEMIPELMTFEGRNFDIIMGLSAPVIGLLLLKNSAPKKLLLTWNVIGLVLVLFILTNGILSTELPFQQFAFHQPNKAVSFFPFILLPATIVPIVVWTHLSDIYKL